MSKIRRMNSPAPRQSAHFARYVSNYDACLNRALSPTGETTEYFARERVRWLARCLDLLGETPRSVLDFGCGIGSTAPLLLTGLSCESVHGVDASEEVIERARRERFAPQIHYSVVRELVPNGSFDCAYCNGVFHHIPVEERPAALDFIRSSLRPGGLFALWENNPWNPGTRYVMSRCEFDEDASTISPRAARTIMKRAGLNVVRSDFLFFVPRSLSALRPIEPLLRKVPLGGQYQVLCRKP